MKQFYFLISFLLLSLFTSAQNAPFITTWDIGDNNYSNRVEISIDANYQYNYSIDFGDGVVLTNQTGKVIHGYSNPGKYTIKITGLFPYGQFKDNILSIDQWGDIQWASMSSSFVGCEKLVIEAIDAPDLSQVTNMDRMFSDCDQFNSNINHWDVSNITDMSNLFAYAVNFNQPLNNWDVSNVVNMERMFYRAVSFNQPLNNWNTSSVTNMTQMFSEAYLFNQPLSSWDVSNVTDMSYMFSANVFQRNYSFNQSLDNWNTSSVINMEGMFEFNTSFNSAIGNWDVSNVVDMSNMFRNSFLFNQNIGSWDVSSVTNMSNMFNNALAFNQPLNNWNTSNVTNMVRMFAADYSTLGENSFDQPIGNWDVSNVSLMSGMFNGNINFNQPLNNWNVSNVINMNHMFSGVSFARSTFNQPLGNWDVSNVINMTNMFKDSEFNQPTNNWNTSNVNLMNGMFENSYYNHPLDNWDVSNVTDMSNMFKNNQFFNQPINNWDLSSVNSTNGMFEKAIEFNQPVNNWDVSNITDLSRMFKFASSFNQDISSWLFNSNSNLLNFLDDSDLDYTNYDLLLSNLLSSNIQGLSMGVQGLLYCNELNRNDLINTKGWSLLGDHHLINCSNTFNSGDFVIRYNATSSNPFVNIIAASNYNYKIDFGDGTILNNQTTSSYHTYNTPGVYTISISGSFPKFSIANQENLISVEQWGNIQWKSMENAFSYCENLVINASDTPDLSQVTNMSYMFFQAEKVNQPLNNWDVSNITNMKNLFFNAYNFNQPLDNWDVSNVTIMDGIFLNANSFNQPINSWDVSNITNFSEIFSGASNFNQPLNSWDVSNVTNLYKAFAFSAFNQPLDSWDVSSVINMKETFTGTIFNKSLDNWDVSSVTNMSRLFSISRFNKNINNWDVSGVNNMAAMFRDSQFNQPLNNWDVSNVIEMGSLFEEANFFNQPLSNWDVSNVESMSSMFYKAFKFNHPLDNWDVSNTQNMSQMFREAYNFNQPLGNWDVSNVIDMGFMFDNAYNFNQPLNNWNVSNVIDMGYMFRQSGTNYVSYFNQPLNSWDVSNVTDMRSMFERAENFNQDLSVWIFNDDVIFNDFLAYTNLDVQNYDLLLNSFASQKLYDKYFGADRLKFCNSSARNYLINDLDWYISQDELSSDCNFISGSIIYDFNNDGCDSSDILTNGIMVSVDNINQDYVTFSNLGAYEVSVLGSTFDVSLNNLPNYYSATPASTNVSFVNSSSNTADFCLTANQAVEDLNITLLPVSEARPGYNADYQLVVQNVGTQTIANPSISLDFDNTMQTYVSASPNPSSTTVNQLNFDFTSIAPFESKILDITMNTFQPPTVNGNDILNFTASVTPNTNDYTPADNTFVYDQTVVNSYDPNDKQVLQGEEIYEEQTDEYLDYLIRFQNTGTASAINVRILDTLHPNLDYNTLKPINASHDYHIEITDGNQVEFIFDDINLPDETSDEPGSHGFVAYKIKPKSSIGVGDFITGDAQIYFDFNAPIITNMVSTEVVDNLNTTTYDFSESLKVYPNPTRKQVYLTTTQNLEIEKVTVYNLQGKSLLNFDKDLETLNVEDLSTGIYLMKIETNRGVINKRLIKK